MMIHLLANQDLTPMLVPVESHLEWFHLEIEVIVHSIWENLSEHYNLCQSSPQYQKWVRSIWRITKRTVSKPEDIVVMRCMT